MSRCDYDVVFYRVFCVTLLAVAFTFTVILTNVFVDIDGLLTDKKKYIPETTPVQEAFLNYADIPMEDRREQFSNENKNYNIDINPSYRTKRFIASETTFNAKSPAMKKMLTRRLAALLEELDEEEAKKEERGEITTTPEVAITKRDEVRPEVIRNEDLLHLAMHNILLQGLIGHMDLNDVYKKGHILVETFNERINNKKFTQDTKLKILDSIVNSKEILKNIPDGTKRYNYNEENQFFEEIMKCKKLEEQIARTTLSNENDISNKNKTSKDDKVFIKTVIEINEINRSEGPNKTKPRENIEGLIKLIYNGKSIKVNQLLDETKSQNFCKNNSNHKIEQVTIPVVIKDHTTNINQNIIEQNQNNRKTQSTFLNKVLEEYSRKHSLPKYEYTQNSAKSENVKTQRLKRQIKIQNLGNNTLSKIKLEHGEIKKDEDDLYIEIETHFDGKGIKGEKKKKLVRSLIDKIQKALNSDIEQKRDSDEHIKFIKRTQDPIYSQNEMSLIKKIAPLEPIEHRQLDPIGKILETHENIVDRAGNAWKKKFEGPNFLSVSKSVNSAELNELIIDYDTVLQNGISQRLQKPLNTESMINDDDDSPALLNPYPGNVTLFLKDIDGSGFSIGFNQYAGEPPDRESMKMFDGIENLIREYHKRNDEADNLSFEPVDDRQFNLVKMHDKIANIGQNSHKVYRRSITEARNDYNNDNLQDIRKINDVAIGKKIKSNGVHTFYKKPAFKAVPIEDHRAISKKLKPSEILTTANLNKRKKRSISVKKISNLKSKIKLNRYLNTKSMANTKVFLKRNKRQVRVSGRDQPRVPQKSSDENIFFISRENFYSDKDTTIKAVATVDGETNIKRTEYIDEESPFNNIYRIQNPSEQISQTDNLYNTAQKSKELMSKYPHIFLDKITDPEEIYFGETQYTENKQPYRIQASTKPRKIIDQEMKTTTEHNFVTVLQDLVSKETFGAIMSQPSGPKYKITVKMSPKNKTSTNGFKEIHTSVNKSFDENGLRYYTLLNVSQISKIEKLNKTNNEQNVAEPLEYDPLFDQQNQIKNLLKLHKNRVDLQLNGLLRESDHLEEMIESSKKYTIDKPISLIADIYKDSDTDNVEKAVDSVRIRQENYGTESFPLKTTPISTNTLTLLSSITEVPKSDKSIILDKIKENEKITLEILKKIDTNTQILQMFLQIFSERIDLDKKEHITATNETTEKAAIEVKLDLSKDWKNHERNQNAFFIPNESKNDTIPFVYAYQKSIPFKSQNDQSVVSMVYHGHIHTNPVQSDSNPAPKLEHSVINTDNGRRKFNESKFFLDEMDTFQATPNNNGRVISANIKINTTNLI